MFNSERDASDVIQDESKDRTARWPRSKLFLFIGVWMVGIGIFIQVMAAAPTLTCRKESAAATSCVVTRSILFRLVPIGSEHIPGVRGARSVEQRGTRRSRTRSYHVMLDTAAGECHVGSSYDVYAAIELVHSINQKLAAGAPIDASFGFAFLDWTLRTFGLIASLGGVGPALAGLIALRRGQVAHVTNADCGGLPGCRS
jgi:hypothetical protein